MNSLVPDFIKVYLGMKEDPSFTDFIAEISDFTLASNTDFLSVKSEYVYLEYIDSRFVTPSEDLYAKKSVSFHPRILEY